MEFTAKQIADFLKGEIEGDAEVKLSDLSKIEEGRPGTLTFLSNPKYLPFIYETKADAVLVNRDLVLERPVRATLIRVDDSYRALASLLMLVEQFKPKREGVSSMVSIAKSATCEAKYVGDFVVVGENSVVGEGSLLYPQVFVGNNVKIGKNVTLYAGVKIYDDCVVGDNCILHAGVVVGSDGFGFAPQADGSYQKIPQIGNVVIENDVEIGANTVIDRATMGNTIIRQGVKLDNLVQIAHNVEIGANTVMASQGGVAGSTKIGRNCVFGGQVGIAGHIVVADKTTVGAQSGVPNSVKESGTVLMGYPAISVGGFRRSSVVYKNLPEMQRTIALLERRIAELEKNNK
ncbi:MAG: UDP-3-O-(3-hydroxymyristoyl)glucosamine N-acyltransferase [Paludibacteraceae bacterium]|nr:UDP-3-O-(3-hydroxymyristoyl)glucosamine N-acyltransferase [Paludibacteraceae bacterium]